MISVLPEAGTRSVEEVESWETVAERTQWEIGLLADAAQRFIDICLRTEGGAPPVAKSSEAEKDWQIHEIQHRLVAITEILDDAKKDDAQLSEEELLRIYGPYTSAKPGTEEKVFMLADRYSKGLPLWHPLDCYDFGPSDLD